MARKKKINKKGKVKKVVKKKLTKKNKKKKNNFKKKESVILDEERLKDELALKEQKEEFDDLYDPELAKFYSDEDEVEEESYYVAEEGYTIDDDY